MPGFGAFGQVNTGHEPEVANTVVCDQVLIEQPVAGPLQLTNPVLFQDTVCLPLIGCMQLGVTVSVMRLKLATCCTMPELPFK